METLILLALAVFLISTTLLLWNLHREGELKEFLCWIANFLLIVVPLYSGAVLVVLLIEYLFGGR